MPTERSPLLPHSASDRPTSSALGGFYKAWHEAKAIMRSNRLHWLLVIVPFAITVPNRSWSPVTVFATNLRSRTHSDLFCDETRPDETEDSVISIVAATAVLAITVALAVICADNLVGSINPFAEVTHVGPDFIGFMLVPIAINAAKASAAVGKATRNRMDLAMDIILNSITETGLLVAPCLVILAWALFHKSMTLHFECFAARVLFHHIPSCILQPCRWLRVPDVGSAKNHETP
ncbi:Vacuolar calcium ion transporter [Colletotrichum fructicola Nara gc5]|uniref:Vacuolar calcium ion transporter n=1 Tax=Colletotrichum fructicola (strain Nara gc5) TaxID=1213859 RepID=A0A7J6JBU5_COLFN|nr:Vacuolar calcium ion transporter [Colletotrichum fructicola Nara gc5]